MGKIKWLIAVFAAMFGIFGASAARTVSISEQTASSVTFRFGAADGQAYGLYLAHGATDADDDKYGWTDFVKIADVGANQTSLDYTVPEQYRDGGFVRFFLMQTEGLAIKKELAEVRSTGAQWVDTGVAPTTTMAADFRFGKVTYVNHTVFFGRTWSGDMYLFNQQSNNFYFHGRNTTNSGLAVQPNTDYRMVFDRSSRFIIYSGDGKTMLASVGNGNTISGGGNIAVFGSNDGANLVTCSFYRFKLANVGSDNGRACRDLIPAVGLDGEAGLYDQVGGIFYKSKTATPLVAGAERPAARFGRVLDETPSFSFRRSIAVTELTETTATLAFGNPDGKVHKLYVAYGNADKDADKNAWTSFTEVADIAADATSYTYTLPAELKQNGVLYRFFLVQTANLPYASELASIKSSKQQTIRIGYIPMADTTADFHFGEVGYASSTAFWGQGWAGSCYLFNMQGSTQFYFHSSGQAMETIAGSTDYRCRVLPNNMCEISKSGSCNQTGIDRLTTPIEPMAVFSCPGKDHASQYRFYNLKLKDDGLLVRDLLPVQTTGGKGALYDRVNNVLYTNDTATDFSQGAAVARQGRVLDTTGTIVGGAVQLPAFIRLTEDTDLTGQSALLRDGTEIDLNGFTLKLTGDSALAAKEFAIVGTTGTLDFTVPSATEYNIGNFTFYTNPSAIIKHGAGVLNLNVRIIGVPSVVVEEGMVKSGVGSVMGSSVTVTVKNGAGYDMNGYPDSNMHLVIEGTGPDGKGALRNSRAAIGNGSQQIYNISLTGDATIGGDYNFGMIRDNYNENFLELNGHTLTFDLASASVNFWISHVTSTTSGTIHVKKGTLDFRHNSHADNLPNVDFIIDGADAKFYIDSTYPKSVTIRDMTVTNGGVYQMGSNRLYLRNLNVIGSGSVTGTVSWTYVSGTVTVDNPTETVNLDTPFTNNGSYPKLVKRGAGTLNIRNNHSDQRFDQGVEIFGGTVVMDSTHANQTYHVAISSQPVPYIIHNGGTLDMRKCTQPVKMSSLVVDQGGSILHNNSNTIDFTNGTTFTKPEPFAFTGNVTFNGGTSKNTEWNLTDYFADANAPAAGTTITLLSAGTVGGNCNLKVTGCPYPYDILNYSDRILLRTKSAAQAELSPIKIFTIGGDYIEGMANNRCFRQPLARNLSALGWNVKLTGWHKTVWYQPNGLHTTDTVYWNFHSGVKDLALKTSATRAGVLEGLESYCLTAENPEFTIFVCGDMDVADGVADATILANYKEAVTRIKTALPMTTVIASSIPGGSAQLNSDIAAWCAAESDVEYIDLATIFGSDKITSANAEAAGTALTTLITSLATANGKNTPSSWTPPTVTLGGENNVPANYRNGFVHVRSLDLGDTFQYNHNGDDATPYTYTPPMRRTGIAKAGYYAELVHKTSGNHMAVWVDMDAPGSNWTNVSLPYTGSQTQQKTVHKLHVWSNSPAVQQVAYNDDSVDGYIEFHVANYSGTERTGDVVAEPWSAAFGFNDTLSSANTGHGCFQVMRKFADANAFPAAEVLFTFTNFGANNEAKNYGFGIGTLANYGNHTYYTSKELDRTFLSGTGDSDGARLGPASYSVRRIEFWVKYDDTPTDRAAMANFQWKTDGDGQFWNLANWVSTADGTTACTSFDYTTYLFPAGGNYTPTYIHYDNVTHWATKFMIDGTLNMTQVGGFYNDSFNIGPQGKLVIDPTRFCWRLRAAPTFEPGGKLALSPNWASSTNGRFLICYWDIGTIDLDAANAAFDTTSAQGINPKLYVEQVGTGGRLWLDLDYGTVKPRINVLCIGDSITQGDDGSYGNWRTPLMKKICASGYEAWSKGFWTIQSNDLNNRPLPQEWTHHAGISGQRLETKGGGGTIDAIEATLDQAGNVDFVLVKLGTNDINSNGSTAEHLFPIWVELVNKILTQKPHAIFIAGAVVDQAYNADKNAQVIAFNEMMKKAIEVDHLFPAKRAYYCDLYTACYRYDVNNNNALIDHMFQGATDLHPDWYGEDKMAEAYLATIKTALADQDSSWQLDARETYPATIGAENNVPAEYRAGYSRARVLDIAKNCHNVLTKDGTVPYEDYSGNTGAIDDLQRVGYYIELRRKDDSQSEFNGFTRWLWVSLDAFNDRTITGVGLPLASSATTQGPATNLRIKTNMPGIADTAADAVGVDGWIEFWPHSYNGDARSVAGQPAQTWGYDWNDTYTTSSYGCMQIHRLTPGERNAAQVIFALNGFTSASNNRYWEVGIGNFANQTLGSMDWTFSGGDDKYMWTTMSSLGFEIAKIEIWTMQYPAAPTTEIKSIAQNGTDTELLLDVKSLGHGAESANMTLEWSTDPDFGTVTGSADLGSVTEAGMVNATVANLATGSQWYFRVTSSNSSGSATVTSDPYEVANNVWRPQTTSDTWASVAWKKNGEGDSIVFNPLWGALFDGTEGVKPSAVTVGSDVRVTKVTFTGSSNYTLAGAGKITADKVEKSGTGTLTVNGAGFDGMGDITVKGGTLKLGANIGNHALGTPGGTLRIDGSTAVLDLNAAGNDTTHNNNIHSKVLVLANGGTMVNNGSSDTSGGPGRLYIEGEGTLAGTKRFDVRDVGSDPDCKVTQITGDENATLNINNSGQMVCINNPQPMEIKKMVIKNPGRVRFENNGTHNIKEGIHFETGGQLGIWNSTISAGAGIVVDSGITGNIFTENSTGNVKGPITIDGTLKNTAGETHFQGAITNRNSFQLTGGAVRIDTSATYVTENNGVLADASNTRVNFYPGKVIGDVNASSSQSQFWVCNFTDWGDYALNMTLSGGGSLVIGDNNSIATGAAMPRFKPGKLRVTVANSGNGSVFYHPNQSDTIYGPTITGTLGTFYAQGPTFCKPIVGIGSNLVVNANNFQAGTANGYGEWTFEGEDTSIFAKKLIIGSQESTTYQGSMTFKEGELTIGSDGLTTAWRMPHRPQFAMVGGTLKAGANFAITQPGMTASFGTPVKEGSVVVDLNGHNINWQTGLNGASDVTIRGNGQFQSGRAGIQGIPTGKWTVESTGAVSLRNAAGFPGGLELGEGANVTLDIAGESMIEFLAWTWRTGNAWNVMQPLFEANTISFNAPQVATSLAFFNRAKSAITDDKHGNGVGYIGLGEFYVSAEEAGEWTFYNKSSSHNGLEIDKTELSRAGEGGTSTTTITLTEGWHKFYVSFYRGAANATYGPVNASDVGTYLYKNKVYTDYRKFDTTMLPMRMRHEPQARTTVRCRRIQKFADSMNIYQTVKDNEWTNDDTLWTLVDWLHTKYSTGVNAPIGGRAARFDGYFHVAKNQSGVWTFQGAYDDRITFEVDDRRLLVASGSTAVTGSISLTPGWHKFVIMIADGTASGNTTSGTGGYLTDSHSNVTALKFSVNGAGYDSFDERYVPIALQPGESQKVERPGLEDVTVAAGATLTNDTDAGGYCPIYGKLTAGAGATVAGPFRFAGNFNVLEVAGVHDQTNLGLTLTNPDESMLAGLKKLKVVFSETPSMPYYYLSPALGLTAETIANVTFSVFVQSVDCTSDFRLTVENGNLCLVSTFVLAESVEGNMVADVVFSKDWIVSNIAGYAEMTEEQLAAELVAPQANGVKAWQNYVMGIDGKNEANALQATFKPAAGSSAVEPKTTICFAFTPSPTPPQNTGVTVTYTLLTSTDGGEHWTEGTVQNGLVKDTPEFTIAMPAVNTLYRIRVNFAPAQ